MATSERPALQSVPPELAELPVLSLLPAELRALVLASFERVAYRFGEVVVRQGDPPDAFYVLLSGTVRVLATGADGGEVAVDSMGPGEGFGEEALFSDTPRTATVRASEPLEVARLDGAVFRALVALHPEVADGFAQQRRVRRLTKLLRTHPAFSRIPRAAFGEFLKDLEPVTAADGEEVVRAGDPSDSLYVVEDGRLRALRDGVELRPLRTGDVLGERGVLLGEPRSATVVAEGDVALLRLPEPAFRRLVRDHPPVGEALEERLRLYARRDRPAPAPAAAPPAEPGGEGVARGTVVEELPAAAPAGPARPRRLRRAFPLVRQLDAMDCGAACVAMACRAFGHAVSLSHIRTVVGTGFDGTSLRGIQRGGELVGLEVTPVKASKDRLDELPLPAIVHVDGNHWVVLHRVRADRVDVADPAVGLRTLARAELAQRWSGYAALVAPTPALALAPAAKVSLRWLWPHVRPHRPVLALALVLALVTSGLQMLLPVLSQHVVDDVIPSGDRGRLHLLVGGMVLLLLLTIAIGAVQRLALARAAVRIDASALDDLVGRMLRLPMRWFQSRRSSDVEQRLDGMREVRSLLVEQGIAGLTDVTQLLAALVVMAVYSPVLALAFLATLPVQAGVMHLTSRRLRPVYEGLEEGMSRYRSAQIDALKGIETVKAMGAERELRRSMVRRFDQLARKLLQADLTLALHGAVLDLMAFLVTVGFLWAGALMVIGGSMTIGELLLFNSLVLLASGPVGGLLGLYDEVQMSGVLLGRLQDVFDAEPEQGHDRDHLAAVGDLEGRVTLRDVGFHYPGAPDRPVLQGISLDVAPGTTVALVGRSGCGKSTLLALLAGLSEPTSGTISYDGQAVSTLKVEELRRRVGIVLQQPYLFDDTIARNIAFGEEEPDLAEVRRAAEVADAHDFVAALPLGYDTQVGESGMSLSGGQTQRLAIARAVYRRPPVLLLDEATSALDPESERAVKEGLDRMLDGRTAFVVAHRLSTIRDADLIVVLEGGRIAESGSHEQLLRRDGLYAHLHAQQLG